jgi:hypothetical protein
VSATAGNGQASVAFTAPVSNGGSAITGYTVTATNTTTPASGGQTATGTSSPIVVTGLVNGDRYTFAVTATNAIGSGTSSASSSPVAPAALLAATGSNATLPLGSAGLLLITGLAMLGAARLRGRSGASQVG